MKTLFLGISIVVAVALAAYLLVSQATLNTTGSPGPAEAVPATALVPAMTAVPTVSDPPAMATVVVAGWDVRLEQTNLPPKTGMQNAIDVARRELTGTAAQVITGPVAACWLATNPGQPIPEAGTYMKDRPVWVVTFDKVIARPLSAGPVQTRPDQQPPSLDPYPALAVVFIDADTGESMMVYAKSLAPVTEPEPNPDACKDTNVAC